MMPVYIIVKRGSLRLQYNIGIKVKYAFKGTDLNEKEPNRKPKKNLLNKLQFFTDEYVINHPAWTKDQLKEQLDLFFNRETKKSAQKPFTYYVLEYSKLKNNPATSYMYRHTADLINQYDAKMVEPNKVWLDKYYVQLRKNMSINGAGKEFRNIRTVCNYYDLALGVFRKWSIPVEETEPNQLSIDELLSIRDYSGDNYIKKYSDFFMLSFYFGGINPVDLLTSCSIINDRLVFVRTKTNKDNAKHIHKISLPITEPARILLNKYKGKHHLLSFMDNRKSYLSFTHGANTAIKKIVPHATLYSARYTFGDICANTLDINDRAIAMCLGHSWAKTVTSRYISQDRKKIDETINKVVNFLNEIKK